MLYLVVVNKKRKEKKRNINNDLASLPSHDTSPFPYFLSANFFISSCAFPSTTFAFS